MVNSEVDDEVGNGWRWLTVRLAMVNSEVDDEVGDG